jgi:two-component system response regulator RpaA
MSNVRAHELSTVPRTLPPDLVAGGRVFTTGAVAKICKVAPRTVSKWFDAGRLGGYRIPGSNDRRVPEAELLAFMRREGIPVPVGLLPKTAVAFGLPETVAVAAACPTAYDLGAAVKGSRIGAIVVGDGRRPRPRDVARLRGRGGPLRGRRGPACR